MRHLTLRNIVGASLALYLGYIMCGGTFADARGSKRVEQPVPIASLAPSPFPVGLAPLVVLGPDVGPNVDRVFAQKALDLINAIHWNGCLEHAISNHKFKSLNAVVKPNVKTPVEAWKRFVGGAPYKLDLRWYYSRFSKVVGYTYNFTSDTYGEAPEGVSETHIWSNTKFINLKNPAGYAAHLMHEKSHNGDAGGFVHFTIFGGSFPYDVGDIGEGCIDMYLRNSAELLKDAA